jgi:hypothetical protein
MAGLTIKIRGDASQFTKTMSGVKGTISSVATPLGAITKVGLAIGAAFTAAAGAVALAAYKLNSIGEEGRASDAKLKNVVKTMGLFGGQSETVANRLLDVADATARKIGVDDDLIASTQAILMSFEDIGKSADVTGGLFDQVTKAALDMSVLFGGDATGYAIQLGKALSDPEKGLAALKKTGALLPADIKRIGDEFARTGDKGKAMADVIASVNRQVEEQSAAVAKTSERIKVSLGQVIESFAKPFSEGFNALPAALESVFPAMSAKATELGSVVGTSLASAIAGDVSKLAEVGSAIGSLIGNGILIGLRSVRNEIDLTLSDYVPITRLTKELVALKTGTSNKQVNQAISANMNKDAGNDLSAAIQSFNDRMQNLRAAGTVITGPTGDKFRPAFAGEQSIYQDSSGNKIVPLLEKIVTNTTAKPFPSN